jgi:DNA-binding transcriptional ArsR family regulator
MHRIFPIGIDGQIYIGQFRWMNTDTALSALSALAHPTRLEAFRLLVQHEPEGLSTGELVDASGLTQSTFSTHLAVLAKAGLVKSEKQGRQQIQRADIDTLRELMLFLAKDCCQGRTELCEPLLAELACC